MCVNNLPKVVTWQQLGRELNSRPLESQKNRLNHYTTRPHIVDARQIDSDVYVQ